MQTQQHVLKQELSTALKAILDWWKTYTVDTAHGGFYGKVLPDNQPDALANKGLILHARILWAFSRGYTITQDASYKLMADRAYVYILTTFLDDKHGGYYSAVTYNGTPVNGNKETVAQAYVLYALTEYAIAFNTNAFNTPLEKTLAFDKYIEATIELLQTHFYDNTLQLYKSEANHNLIPIATTEMQIGSQLHVLEAFTNAYIYSPDDLLYKQIKHLIQVIIKYFYHKPLQYIIRAVDVNYKATNSNINYGHNMEAAWLLYHAAKQIGDALLIKETETIILAVCESIQEGTDEDGGIWCDKKDGNIVYEKHWWTQTEALTTFGYGYHITHNELYLQKAIHTWQYIQKNFIDTVYGEWHYARDKHHNILYDQGKADFWKCPYHNVRVCAELITQL
jgi:cellobiose epimerase